MARIGKHTTMGSNSAPMAVSRDRVIFKSFTVLTGRRSCHSTGSLPRSFRARAWTFAQVKGLETCIRLLSLKDTVNEFDFMTLLLFSHNGRNKKNGYHSPFAKTTVRFLLRRVKTYREGSRIF